jgi:ribose transport system permease protein
MSVMSASSASTPSGGFLRRFAVTYSLQILLVGVIAIFSLIRPESYFTALNAQMIASTNAVLAILALAAVPALVTGQFDLSIGFQLALAQAVCVGLIIHQGLPTPIATALAFAACLVVGLANGFLVARLGLNAFITTLATGIVVQGVTQWYTNGESLFGAMSPEFLTVGRGQILGVPLPLIYVLLIACAMWALYRYTDWGRRCFAIGGNARAAHLMGIPAERIVTQSFVLGSALAALAGLLSSTILGSANPNVGVNFLLPAFAAVFLGAAPAGPGRFNAWGTVLAVYALAAGIAGLQQLGAAFYVEQFFNGGALLIAIAAARWIALRRVRALAR